MPAQNKYEKFKYYISDGHFSATLLAGQPNQKVLDYIDQYKEIAVREMITYKIPASITMAQGILESGAGQSELALKSNNHFGIKCHTDWKGEKYIMTMMLKMSALENMNMLKNPIVITANF